LATALRRRGIDVTTPLDAGLTSADDERQLAFADAENRVVVTQDSDFLQLHQAGIRHAGIAYYVPGARTLGYLVRYLCLMNDCLTPEEMRGQVEYL
jgi:Domain of unknown function (DUF5615)